MRAGGIAGNGFDREQGFEQKETKETKGKGKEEMKISKPLHHNRFCLPPSLPVLPSVQKPSCHLLKNTNDHPPI
jgi:hypothetical protein